MRIITLALSAVLLLSLRAAHAYAPAAEADAVDTMLADAHKAAALMTTPPSAPAGEFKEAKGSPTSQAPVCPLMAKRSRRGDCYYYCSFGIIHRTFRNDPPPAGGSSVPGCYAGVATRTREEASLTSSGR